MLAALPPTLDEGRDTPMGSHAVAGGVNFAVFSDHATRIELCLFDSEGLRELHRYPLHGPTDGIWHGFLPGAGPGLVYGLRAHGPWAPEAGHRFNAHKLLLDPCAREIVGRHVWRPEHLAEGPGGLPDERDNAAWALKARVAPPAPVAPGWRDAPRHAERDLVIYEVHVKGFSMLHPDIPPVLRGTYSALAHPAAIAHFHRLGVNAIELLPVHYHLDEPFLGPKGLRNHWGYNTIGFFCPDPRFALHPHDPSAVNEEFRRMVATLHHHGIEVLLDVVYNHTAEGGNGGSSLSFRGLDQASWYRLHPGTGQCLDFTGCGNTLNVVHPRVTQFVLDSLRWWARGMGVAGFRFDLAPVLARTYPHFDVGAPFLAAAAQDPVLSRTRLIAEAWDAGPDGYHVGRFPNRWLEWNDRFRDTVRHYWLGFPASRGDFARRFAASDDLFHHGRRKPTASVNFVAAHDGFTLADLSSRSRKDNHANGESNHDGRDHEACANLGEEGPSEDPVVEQRRAHVRRAMMATLLLAQGTPMINAGDEILNTQHGNNNAWNQDNPTGWLDWPHADHGFAAFVAEVVALRRSEPLLRHPRWFRPPAAAAADPREPLMSWSAPDGSDLGAADWHDPQPRAFACHVVAGAARALHGSDAILIAFNPEPATVTFALPASAGDGWSVALDTADPRRQGSAAAVRLTLAARSLVVLRTRRPASADDPHP